MLMLACPVLSGLAIKLLSWDVQILGAQPDVAQVLLCAVPSGEGAWLPARHAAAGLLQEWL